MIFLKQLEEELTASFFKERLLSKLHVAGIPEVDVNIRMASEKTSDKNPNRIGFYRQLSQFSSKPYMNLSLKTTYSSLINLDYIDSETPYERVRAEVLENLIDTICHEYGHVIEEYVNVMYRREMSQDNSIEINRVFKEFRENFVDNEDFAEQFGLWLSRRDFMSDESALFKVINYYCKEVFSQESLEWVKLPKNQREVIFILDETARMEKWDNVTDEMLGQSLNACNDVIKSLKNTKFSENYLVKLSQPQNFKNFKLEDVQFEQYSHHVLEVVQDGESIYLDLLNGHTTGTLFSSLDDLEKNWKSIERQELKTTKVKKSKIV